MASSYFTCNDCGGRNGSDCRGSYERTCPFIDATFEERQAHRSGEKLLTWPEREGPPTPNDFFYWEASFHILFSDVDDDGYFAIEINPAFGGGERETKVFGPGEPWLPWLGVATRRVHRQWLKDRDQYKLARKPAASIS